MTSRPENHPSVSHRIPKRGPGDGERGEINIGFTPLAATVITEHLSTTAGRNWLRADFDEREETNGPCEQAVAGTKQQQQQERKKQTNLKNNMRIVRND